MSGAVQESVTAGMRSKRRAQTVVGRPSALTGGRLAAGALAASGRFERPGCEVGAVLAIDRGRRRRQSKGVPDLLPGPATAVKTLPRAAGLQPKDPQDQSSLGFVRPRASLLEAAAPGLEQASWLQPWLARAERYLGVPRQERGRLEGPGRSATGVRPRSAGGRCDGSSAWGRAGGGAARSEPRCCRGHQPHRCSQRPPAGSPPRVARPSGRVRTWAGPIAGVVAVWRLACLLVTALASGGLHAETCTTGGLSFSDELGGARLLAASGKGTVSDPIVLVEEITGPGPAILVVRNDRPDHLNVSPAVGFLSLSIVNVIANRGPWRWAGFDLELRITPDQPSVYTDGLSFDQPQTFHRLAKADRFEQTEQEDEPFDRIRFDGGGVDPRDDLRLDFDILDANGRAVFYLVQRPIVLLARNDLQAPAQRIAALDQDRTARSRLR